MKHLVFLMILLTSNTYANSLTKEEFNQAMSYFNAEAFKSLIESEVYNKKGQTYLMNMKSCETLQLFQAKLEIAEENKHHYRTDYAFQKELSQDKSYISTMRSALKEVGLSCN
jgi:hypothetical protein